MKGYEKRAIAFAAIGLNLPRIGDVSRELVRSLDRRGANPFEQIAALRLAELAIRFAQERRGSPDFAEQLAKLDAVVATAGSDATAEASAKLSRRAN